MRLFVFIFINVMILSSSISSATYMKNDNQDDILSKILKEIEEIKKGQDQLSEDLKNLKKDIASGSGSKGKSNSKKGGVKDVEVGNSIVLGNPNAKVSVIKWTDFQWTYCARSVSLVDQVLAKYPNDVKVVIKNFPLGFHKQARKAAKYALAAGKQGKYKEMYHIIMANYKQLKTGMPESGWYDTDLPVVWAKELGLDTEKLLRDAQDPAFEALIKWESNQLSQTFERKSVPKFLVAGKEPPSRDLDGFSLLIDEALKK